MKKKHIILGASLLSALVAGLCPFIAEAKTETVDENAEYEQNIKNDENKEDEHTSQINKNKEENFDINKNKNEEIINNYVSTNNPKIERQTLTLI